MIFANFGSAAARKSPNRQKQIAHSCAADPLRSGRSTRADHTPPPRTKRLFLNYQSKPYIVYSGGPSTIWGGTGKTQTRAGWEKNEDNFRKHTPDQRKTHTPAPPEGNTTILFSCSAIPLVVSKPDHFFVGEGPKTTSPLKYPAEAVHTRVRRTHASTGHFTNPDQGTLHDVYCFYYDPLALNFFCVRRMESCAQQFTIFRAVFAVFVGDG